MNRDAARSDEQALAAAVQEIRRFFETVGDRLPVLDPFETHEPPPVVDDDIRDEIHAALVDRDWIEGYRLGRDDARRDNARHAPRGPGATPDPKDGWSPSRTRAEAYALGRLDAARI